MHITVSRLILMIMRVCVCLCQVGPGVVFLLFHHSFLGRGVIIQCVTPVEPLLQCVSHTIFYQSNIPPVVPKFILKAECIQVQYKLTLFCHSNTVFQCEIRAAASQDKSLNALTLL